MDGGQLLMAERGEIIYPARIKQVYTFSGFRYGTKTPTDIDFLIEYDDQAWVFGEVKLKGVPLNVGQRLVLERLVNDSRPKWAIAFFASHEVHDPEKCVEIKSCLVEGYYQRLQAGWFPPKRPITVLEFVDKFITYVETRRSLP